VDYLYDPAGRQNTEVNSSLGWNRIEVYAGGRHLATYSGGATGPMYFTHADWLGTERARTTVTGSLCETISSLAFGDGMSTSGSCGDPSPMHFTGKERDSESGLDNFGARYNSSSLGRFMSPDSHVPSLTNPQSLNKYVLDFNNPLRWIDPNGQFPTEFHVKASTDALKSIGFGNPGAFVRNVNELVDRNHFLANSLHAMSGDNAYLTARQFLLSLAADPGFPNNASQSAVALVVGLHLVQDHVAHEGITGIWGHAKRYRLGDDKNSADENAARDATQAFLSDFKAALVANLGEEGAADALLKIQTAAGGLSLSAISG
jgi:RHS repeat-associated protein